MDRTLNFSLCQIILKFNKNYVISLKQYNSYQVYITFRLTSSYQHQILSPNYKTYYRDNSVLVINSQSQFKYNKNTSNAL